MNGWGAVAATAGMVVHIDQAADFDAFSKGASCNPSLATAGPFCTLGPKDKDDRLQCDCNRWVTDKASVPVSGFNPCKGFMYTSTIATLPCSYM